MSIIEFNEVINGAYDLTTPDYYSRMCAKRMCGKYRSGDEERLRDFFDDLNYDGNMYRSLRDAAKTLRSLYALADFTDDEWQDIIKHIDVFDFNREFTKWYVSVFPLFAEILDYQEDWYLEFWQGAWSLGTHSSNPDSNVNSPENGAHYCEVVGKIKKSLESFVSRWPDLKRAQYTCFHRICGR